MLPKPDFGKVDQRIGWTAERVAWVRHLAEDRRMTARDIALDIGLAADQAPRIYELCKRCKIALTGQGGRRKRLPADGEAVYRVAISGKSTPVLARLASRHSLAAGRVLEILLQAAFETGEPFCENLMDLDADA